MLLTPQTEDEATSSLIEKEESIRKLKRQLEGWREVILLVQSVLLWEQEWYPMLIVGVYSAICLIFWKLGPTLLSTISIVCLLLTILDTLVPILSSKFFDPQNWTDNKEKQFEDFCKTVVEYKMLFSQNWTSFQTMKKAQPKFYYTITISVLFLLAWIGKCNNWKFYIFGLILLLTPGLIHQQNYRILSLRFKSVIDSCNNRKTKKN